MAKSDFSVALDEIRAPGVGDVGSLVSAGVSEGKADAIRGQSNANMISFLGTTALDAAKGYMEAQVAKETQATLDDLDTGDFKGKNVLAREAAPMPPTPMGPLEPTAPAETLADASPEVSSMRQEGQRFVEAVNQGTMGRDEAVARIAAVVKKYSALAPGWASDFRKSAAELTGISNIDVYGAHQALTQRSTREKLALHLAEQQMALDKELASKFGIALNQITPEHRAYYATVQGTDMKVKHLDNLAKAGNMQQADIDKVRDQQAATYVQGAISDLALKQSKFAAAMLDANTPDKALAAQRMGAQLAAEVDIATNLLVQQVGALGVGQHPMSAENVKKRIDDIKSTMGVFKEAVKNGDGLSFWNAIVKNAQGKAEYLTAAIQTANPHLKQLNDLGFTKGMAEAWFTLGGNKDEFAKRFGKDAADAVSRAMTNPDTYTSLFGAVAAGKSTLPEAAKVDPKIGKVVFQDVYKALDKVRTEGGFSDDKQKVPFSNMMAAYTSSFNFKLPSELGKFKELMFDTRTTDALGKLTPELRANALGPLFARIDTSVPEEINAVRTMAAGLGEGMNVKFDEFTNRLVLDVPRSRAFGSTEGGAATMYNTPTDRSPEMLEKISNIQNRLDWINSAVDVASSTLPLVHYSTAPEVQKDALMSKVWGMYQSGNVGPLFSGVLRNKLTNPAGPQAASAQTEDQKSAILNAIVKAERSDINAGTSPKGALGRYQIMPETAKELGLKVGDGVDERLDDTKAGEAAWSYITKHAKDFGGDWAKAAAAYNAGAANVRKALERAKKEGSPEDWVFFLPKPSETGPYIKRFLSAMNGGQAASR